MTKTYSLKKSRYTLHASYSWFKKRGKQLSESVRNKLEQDLRALENAEIEEVRFVLFSADDYSVYEDVLNNL